MKRLTTALAMMALVVYAPLPILSQTARSSQQAPQPDEQAEATFKRATYQRFVDNYKQNQPEAVTAARLYLDKYGADNDEVVRYLTRWIVRYDKATGADGFQMKSISCGMITEITFQTKRGEELSYTEWQPHASPALATAALEKELALMVEILERRAVLDDQGLRVGERVVAKRDALTIVLKVEGEKLTRITAPSVQIIEEFEKTGRP